MQSILTSYDFMRFKRINNKAAAALAFSIFFAETEVIFAQTQQQIKTPDAFDRLNDAVEFGQISIEDLEKEMNKFGKSIDKVKEALNRYKNEISRGLEIQKAGQRQQIELIGGLLEQLGTVSRGGAILPTKTRTELEKVDNDKALPPENKKRKKEQLLIKGASEAMIGLVRQTQETGDNYLSAQIRGRNIIIAARNNFIEELRALGKADQAIQKGIVEILNKR